MLEEYKLLLIILTETWLRDHYDAEVSIKNYTLLRADRSRQKKSRGRNSGGVGVYLRNDLAAGSDVLLKYSSEGVEALCIRVDALNLILCSIYRPPDDRGGHRSTAAQLIPLLAKLSELYSSLASPTPNIIMAGDFNLPHATWPEGLPKPGATPDERNMLELLTSMCAEHFLTQLSTEPTHRAGNTLDLLFTNNPELFVSLDTIPVAPISSHFLLISPTLLDTNNVPHSYDNMQQSGFDKVNLHSDETNWTEIKSGLEQIDWTQTFDSKSVSEMLDLLCRKCEYLAESNAPEKSRRRHQTSRIPRHRRILMKKRTRLRKQLKPGMRPQRRKAVEEKLYDIERKLQESYRNQEIFEENRAVANIKTNSKFFYSYARKRAKTYVPVGPLADPNGNLVSAPASMAKILSNQYQQAFSTPSANLMYTGPAQGNAVEDLDFTPNDIIQAIDEVSMNSAPGSDRFPAVFLKNCKNQLAPPLYLIWRKSMDTGEIPTCLKNSIITPIHKGGSRKVPKNYRPVTLTSHLIKVFEKIIRNKLVNHFERNNLLNPNQHGFRAGRSCLSQLLQHQDKITGILERGGNVDVIYLDFSKAFDKLDINITLQKLQNLRVTGKIFKWIESFLTGRQQIVTVEGAKSDPVNVISGVPQGSVLGPLLFLVLLNDIDNNTHSSSVSSFADDTRILAGISNTDDVRKLQIDLNAIFEWARQNNATFNDDKFECIRYGKNDEIRNSTAYISNNGAAIKCEEYVRDLGVTLSQDAVFSKHISEIKTSANLKAGWILRTFQTRDKLLLKTLWKSLVAPILDYCCQLWSPRSVGQIQSLEKVQNNFFSKITGLSQLDYWQQLETLKMLSLERRRERYICIYVWKTLEAMVPNFGLESTYNLRRGRLCIVPPITRGASQRIQTIRFNSLGVFGPRLFNCLPVSIRNMSGCSLNSFKRALDRHLSTIPDQPRVPKMVRYCTKPSNSLIDN